MGDTDKRVGVFGCLGRFHALGSRVAALLQCSPVSRGARSSRLKIPQAACQSVLGLFNCSESLLPCLLVRVESWLQ